MWWLQRDVFVLLLFTLVARTKLARILHTIAKCTAREYSYKGTWRFKSRAELFSHHKKRLWRLMTLLCHS